MPPKPNRPTTSPILLRPDGLFIASASAGRLVADAAAADPAAPAPGKFTIAGYRQTELPVCKGGRLLNSNFWRFRHKGMRAIARSFRGGTFVSGHEWGDVRARAGTIADAWADPDPEVADELVFFFEVEVVEPWALEQIARGTIDRFSIGAKAIGPGHCTVHEAPLWQKDECWDAFCWPGYETEGLLVELEFQDAVGKELSPVNVPAVERTAIVEIAAASAAPAQAELADPAGLEAAMAAIAAAAGRSAPGISRLADRARARGGFTRPRPAQTMASPTQENRMDPREKMALKLGLSKDATWEQIEAKQDELVRASAATEAQLAEATATAEAARAATEAGEVEATIARLKAAGRADKTLEILRNTHKTQGRAAFDAAVAAVDAMPARPALQSDQRAAADATIAAAATAAGAGSAAGASAAGGELDAYEANKDNPELLPLARRCGVTVDQIRAHGARTVNVVPNLDRLIKDTAARGA